MRKLEPSLRTPQPGTRFQFERLGYFCVDPRFHTRDAGLQSHGDAEGQLGQNRDAQLTVLETVFLDAGGVLVYPNWTRISQALAARGVVVDPAALARAEPHAKKRIDVPQTIKATNDAGRGWMYYNLIFEYAGVPPAPEIDELLRSFTPTTRPQTCGSWFHPQWRPRSPLCVSAA